MLNYYGKSALMSITIIVSLINNDITVSLGSGVAALMVLRPEQLNHWLESEFGIAKYEGPWSHHTYS